MRTYPRSIITVLLAFVTICLPPDANAISHRYDPCVELSDAVGGFMQAQGVIANGAVDDMFFAVSLYQDGWISHEAAYGEIEVAKQDALLTIEDLWDAMRDEIDESSCQDQALKDYLVANADAAWAYYMNYIWGFAEQAHARLDELWLQPPNDGLSSPTQPHGGSRPGLIMDGIHRNSIGKCDAASGLCQMN